MANLFSVSKDQEQHAFDLLDKNVNILSMYAYCFEVDVVGFGPWRHGPYKPAQPEMIAELNEKRKKSKLTASVAHCFHTKMSFRDAALRIWEHHKLAEASKGDLSICKTAEDVEQCKKDGRVGMLLSWQDPNCLEYTLDLEFLDIFYQLGIRNFQITYNHRSLFGDGCCERANAGLSEIGIKLIERMNKRGIIVDCSHAGDKTSMEAIELSKNPCIFSHSGARAIFDDPLHHNVDDERLKALAEKGGTWGADTWPPHLAFSPKLPTIYDYLDQIDHVVKVAGVDTIALGPDMAEVYPAEDTEWQKKFEPGFGRMMAEHNLTLPWMPETDSLEKHLANTTLGLISRGYSDQDIQKILGGNLLRVFRRVFGS